MIISKEMTIIEENNHRLKSVLAALDNKYWLRTRMPKITIKGKSRCVR